MRPVTQVRCPGCQSWLRIPTEGRDWPWLKITYRQEENKWYGVTVNGSNDLPLATIIGTLDEYSGETSRHIKRHSALAEVLRKYGCPSLRLRSMSSRTSARETGSS